MFDRNIHMTDDRTKMIYSGKFILALSFVIFFFVFLFTTYVHAQALIPAEVILTPTIISETADPRDIIKKTIVLENRGGIKADVYAIVQDLSAASGSQPALPAASLDKTHSLSSWIRIKRGVTELFPGDRKEVPLEIDVSLAALPGDHYARITFAAGHNLPEAEAAMAASPQPTLLINVKVSDQSVEKAQLTVFKSGRSVYVRPPVDFHFSVKNAGNVPLSPRGKAYLYNRRQQEAAALNVVTDEPIAPGESRDYAVSWSVLGGMGKYKARLELDYGQAGILELQDTLYFWIMPLPILIGFLIALFLVIGLSTFVLLRRTRATQRSVAAHHREQASGVINLREE